VLGSELEPVLGSDPGDGVVLGSDEVDGEVDEPRPVELGEGGVMLPPGIVEVPVVPLGP
jgi:hypothetical protein